MLKIIENLKISNICFLLYEYLLDIQILFKTYLDINYRKTRVSDIFKT